MAFSVQEKTQILSAYHWIGSIKLTRRCVKRVSQRKIAPRNDILRQMQSFLDTERISHREADGRPRTGEHTIESVRDLSQNDPKVSLRAASARRIIPKSTTHSILRKCLFSFPYELRNLLQLLEDKKTSLCSNHCQNHSDGYTHFLSRIVFSYECICRLNGFLNKQNIRIYCIERASESNQLAMNSPSVIKCCIVSKERIIGPYFWERESHGRKLQNNANWE